jgi:hypothetical protein
MPHTPSSHVLLMPNSIHLTQGISNLVSLITKTKLGLSTGRMGPGTIWTGRQEHRVSHQPTQVGSPRTGARALVGLIY